MCPTPGRAIGSGGGSTSDWIAPSGGGIREFPETSGEHRLEMNTAEAESLLRSVGSPAPRLTTEVGRRGDAAYIRMSDESEPGRWADVSTPGDRWISLEVDGGFSLDHFEEGIEPDDLSALISRFVEISVTHLNATTSVSTLNGTLFPVLIVTTAGGSFELRRSLARNLRELLRFPNRRSGSA